MATVERPLTPTERAIAIGYARDYDISAIAALVSLPQEYVGEQLIKLCRLNRQQAHELVRRGRTLPVHAEPPTRRRAPKTVTATATATAEPTQEWPLTDREHQLLKLLATGLPVAAIADRQGYKLLTVQGSIARLYRRLGVAGTDARSAAIAAGVRRGNLTAAEAAAGEAEMARAASEKARTAALAKAAQRKARTEERGQLDPNPREAGR